MTSVALFSYNLFLNTRISKSLQQRRLNHSHGYCYYIRLVINNHTDTLIILCNLVHCLYRMYFFFTCDKGEDEVELL